MFLEKQVLLQQYFFTLGLDLYPDLLGRKDSIPEYVIPDPQHRKFRGSWIMFPLRVSIGSGLI